jgi:hypothetical protein
VLVAAVLTASFGLGAGTALLLPPGTFARLDRAPAGGPDASAAVRTGFPADARDAAQGPTPGPQLPPAPPGPTFDPTRWSFPRAEPRDDEVTALATAAPTYGHRVDAGASTADGPLPVSPPARIELYASDVSIAPGEPLRLHVSTPATTYQLSINRVDARRVDGFETAAGAAARPGHDYRGLGTFDRVTRTARANWPETDRFETAGWQPGVYLAEGLDSNGKQGHAIFVVRSPTLAPNRPTFVFTALTYQAYNLWGGANLYSYAAPPATRVSFERPYDQGGGRGFWGRYDDRILAWLQRQALELQSTTDYDLATHPPDAAPGLLVFPQHAEYVPRSLRDWIDRRLNEVGDLRLLSLGSNGFYWQVRLAAPRTLGAPLEIVCYKDASMDPAADDAPELATSRWRDLPVGQPEGRMLGAQYVGILGDGATRFDLRVTSAMPPALLAGTGWGQGTVVRGVLVGEGDAADPGVGGLAVMAGEARDPDGQPLRPTVTIRTSPAGGRAFLAGTFAWVDGLPPSRVNLGVPAGSFERFTQNVLSWLGART